MSRTVRIRERFALAGGRVDREAGVIRNALICGVKSENGRDYEWSGRLKGAHTVYEGALTNCDHGTDDTVDRRFGWWRDVGPGDDGRPRGDFHMLKSHPMYERVMEAAEKGAPLYGFSHVIEAKTSRRNGREIVESIEKVISIDLVATAATMKSFLESVGSQPVPTTLRKVIESLRDKLPADRQSVARKLLLLSEDDAAMGGLMDAPVEEPAAETDPDQAISDAFRQAMHAQIDALLAGSHTLAELISKIRELGKAHGKLTGSGGGESEGGGEEETPKESKKPTLDDVIAECKRAKLDHPPVELLEALTDPAKLRQLAIEQSLKASKVSEAEAPKSAPRGKATVAESKVPTDPKAFAQSIKN